MKEWIQQSTEQILCMTSSTNVEISDGPTKATLMKCIKKSISYKQNEEEISLEQPIDVSLVSCITQSSNTTLIESYV